MPGSVLKDTFGGTQETLYIWCQASNPVGFESGRWHVGRESELLNVCAWDGILSPAYVPHAFQRLERRSEESRGKLASFAGKKDFTACFRREEIHFRRQGADYGGLALPRGHT